MPASDLEWSAVGRSPIFQVYGTKRKAAEVTTTEVHNCDQQHQHPKRPCHWVNPQLPPQQDPNLHQPELTSLDHSCNNNNNNTIIASPGATPFSNTCNGMEMNHNSPAMEDQQIIYEQQQHRHHQITHRALSQVMSQQPPRVPSPWPSHQPFHQLPPQDDQIMDINGETFNPMATAAAEMDAASSHMESDSTTNTHQYQMHHEGPQKSPSSEFCKNFCGIGESSPTSGRVRCYCKPSWEGMLDMKPYVSDVY